MAMRKTKVLTLTAGATNQKLERGDLEIDKGKLLVGLRLMVSLSLANSSGGSITLSDAQRQALFDLLSFDLNVGDSGKYQKPFISVLGSRLHRQARKAFWTELEGYTDSSTGLARALPNSATTAVQFDLLIPLGAQAGLVGVPKAFWGVGRSQAKLIELLVRKSADSFGVSGLVISGNVNIDVVPVERSVKGDRVSVLPVYEEKDEADKTTVGPEGLHLDVCERTAVHASSASTSLTLSIDGETMFEQMRPSETVRELLDSPDLPSIALPTDRETVLYLATNRETPFDKLPTGRVIVFQNAKDLATFKAGFTYVPILETSAVKALIAECAAQRKKPVLAVSLAAVEGIKVPKRLMPFVPFVLFDKDDAEFGRLPGLLCTKPGDANSIEEFVPPELATSMARARADFSARGLGAAAENVTEQVAALIPGAVQSARGFARGGSDILAKVKARY